MRQKLTLLFLPLTICMMIALSCTLETSDNGNFDGAWHMLRINGNTLEYTQMYWNVQGNLLELRDKKDGNGRFLLRFERNKGQLTLSNPYIYDRDNGDVTLQDSAKLIPYGIDNLDEPFEIVTLNTSRMTLKSSTKKLDFRKF